MRKILQLNKTVVGICLLAVLFTLPRPAKAGEESTERAGDLLLIIAPLAYGYTFMIDDKEGRVQFYKSFFSNLGFTYGLKLSINKRRPDDSDNNSFPSYHTSAAFQAATFIQQRYGWKYALPAYAGATFVGYSRKAAEKHFVEDIVAGAAIGILTSYYFTTPYKSVNITPITAGGYYGLSISRHW